MNVRAPSLENAHMYTLKSLLLFLMRLSSSSSVTPFSRMMEIQRRGVMREGTAVRSHAADRNGCVCGCEIPLPLAIDWRE